MVYIYPHHQEGDHEAWLKLNPPTRVWNESSNRANTKIAQWMQNLDVGLTFIFARMSLEAKILAANEQIIDSQHKRWPHLDSYYQNRQSISKQAYQLFLMQSNKWIKTDTRLPLFPPEWIYMGMSQWSALLSFDFKSQECVFGHQTAAVWWPAESHY